ncbi:hypothetical protein BDZ85DRAFT_5727 [Elsinoe ampelina]|uniref:N-acetyltransferase domain-containing protein n=1 Tax=Elsinoe ampelina TaxID=302913 RepID=A0A6A6GPH3_9PEZI|nr:hypothetical protein BDZ85DRAFT_5727 [Elsinoe ampelina]
MAPFTIRPATPSKDDGLRLIRNFDSQLPWLAATGSGDQWGSETRSTNPKTLTEYRGKVGKSSSSADEPWTNESTRTWIVEVTVPRAELEGSAVEILGDEGVQGDGGNGLVTIPVAGVVLEGKAVEYIGPVMPVQDEKDPFVFVKYLMTDRRAGELAKGAGAFALRYAVDRARALGFKRVVLDCWSGNGGKLAGFYEKQGFTKVGDFQTERWSGTVLEMRL